jgi:hypothetical protein
MQNVLFASIDFAKDPPTPTPKKSGIRSLVKKNLKIIKL